MTILGTRPEIIRLACILPKLDEYFMLWEPGPWVLGTYAPGGVCMLVALPECLPFGNPATNRTMIEVGTSMMPI